MGDPWYTCEVQHLLTLETPDIHVILHALMWRHENTIKHIYTFTKVHENCLFMVRFAKLKLLQKADKLLDTSELGSLLYHSATILQNWLLQVVMPALYCMVNWNALTT